MKEIVHIIENKKISLYYFKFEEDFIEDGMRCIPMIVRFKLDACGIKLKLSEWSKFSINERELLSEIKCEQKFELEFYRNYLQQLVYNYNGKKAAELTIDEDPAWSHVNEIPFLLKQELAKYHWRISLLQWKSLTNLKRFALMKLCKPGHENKNFPKAIKEFGLAIT